MSHMQINAGQQTGGPGPVCDGSLSAEAWWKINLISANPWCALGLPSISIYPTIMPVSGIITLPIIFPFAQPHFSAMVIPCTWLPHMGPSNTCFPDAQQYFSCSQRNQEPNYSLPWAAASPNLHNDTTQPFGHEQTGWGDISTLDCGLWSDSACPGRTEGLAALMEESGAYCDPVEAPKHGNDPGKRWS